MRNILRENRAFKEFSKRCHEQLQIKKDLDNPEITEERKNNLERSLPHVEKEISKLTIVLQDGIKVS